MRRAARPPPPPPRGERPGSVVFAVPLLLLLLAHAATPAATTTTIPSSTLPPGICGDTVCSAGENCSVCAVDCGLCPLYSCLPSVCVLPNCRCGTEGIPGGLALADTPQFVTLSFDDAVQQNQRAGLFTLLRHTARDAAGCGPRLIYFAQNQYADYHLMQELAAHGSELALHTFMHNTSLSTTEDMWRLQFDAGRNWTAVLSQQLRTSIVGIRAPFLQSNEAMYSAASALGLEYDSSHFEPYAFFWPYTLDFGAAGTNFVGLPPQRAHPGLWSIPVKDLNDTGGVLHSLDPPGNGSTVYNLLVANFQRHLAANRSPFQIALHYTWIFADPTRLTALLNFFDFAATISNVFFVTNTQLLAWMRSPVPASQLAAQPYMACPVLPGPPATPEVCDGLDQDLDGDNDNGVTNFCMYFEGNFDSCATCPPQIPTMSNAPIAPSVVVSSVATQSAVSSGPLSSTIAIAAATRTTGARVIATATTGARVITTATGSETHGTSGGGATHTGVESQGADSPSEFVALAPAWRLAGVVALVSLFALGKLALCAFAVVRGVQARNWGQGPQMAAPMQEMPFARPLQ